jgi:benzoylformate decarboxylase
VDAVTRPSDASLDKLAVRLLTARNPVLIAGHELATRDALKEAGQLAELLGAPVLQQTVPYGAHFLSEHPAFLGALTRSQQQVRAALEPYDLAVFLGADVLRMSVYSAVDPLPEGTAVVQISERDWELGKNYAAEIAIKADVKETLRALIAVVRTKRSAERAAEASRRLNELKTRNWSVTRERLGKEALAAAETRPMDPRYLMSLIGNAVPEDTVVVEEGLWSTNSLLSFLPLRDAQGFYGLASGGIGFAVAGAVGISLAQPGRPVLAIIGDGSAMYGIQALWTAAHLKLPITYLITNNSSYRILKERLKSMRGTDRFIGMDLRNPTIDMVGLAQSLGVKAKRITDPNDVVPALRVAMASGGPSLLDVTVSDGFGG